MANPTTTDQDLAKRSLKSFRKLSKLYKNNANSIEFAVAQDGTAFQLPVAALDSIETILKNLAEGKTSEIISETQYLTTQQAADYLDVSRPFVVRLLESGKIPFKKVGRHRRVLFSELKNYEEKQQQIALQKLKKLTDESQRLNLY
ncbi:MAG: toxin-antitoxin system antidote component [Bacteroidetes bacterium HLUCCA01]|nr:MAG: toxin-antitoxin system antidote component [Bacteroidetes bacterium HLUCCA01]